MRRDRHVAVDNALANERISHYLDESPDSGAQAWLAQCRGNPLVASAEANVDANLASVTVESGRRAAVIAPPGVGLGARHPRAIRRSASISSH